MQLFNGSSMFNEKAIKEISSIANKPKELKNRLIEIKKCF